MTLIAIGRAKVIKDKHRHVQSVFIDKDGINISTEHGQSEHNGTLETSVETTQKLIQSVALHYIVEKTVGLTDNIYRLYTDVGKKVFIKYTDILRSGRYRKNNKLEKIRNNRVESVEQTIDRWNIMLANGLCIVDVIENDEYYLVFEKEKVMKLTRQAEARAMNM